jgi:Zn-dependent protease
MATQQPGEASTRRDEPSSAGRGWRVGRVFGIPVFIQPMWFVIAALMVYTYSNVVRLELPYLNTPQTYLVAAVFAIMLLVSVFLHELGHALVTKAYGIRVYAMTLWMLGGLTETDAENRRPGVDFVIALAGPAVNLVLGGIAVVGLLLTGSEASLLQAMLWQLAYSNIVVGAFNLLPGLPLDGGTMLRAVVWKITSNRFLSTQVAGWVGRIVAVGVVGLAVAGLFTGSTYFSFGLIFTLVIAWFLWSGATQAIRAGRLGDRFELLHAGRMAAPALLVPADLPLSEALRRAAEAGRPGIVVVDSENRPASIVSGESVAATPEDRRPWMAVSAVARSLAPGLVLPATLAGEDMIRAVQAAPATEYLVVSELSPSGQVAGAQVVGVLAARSIADVLDPHESVR